MPQYEYGVFVQNAFIWLRLGAVQLSAP